MSMLGVKTSKRFWVLALMILFLGACGWLGVSWYRTYSACERRGAALDARIARMQEDLRQRIIAGTSKDQIVKVLKENGLSVSVNTQDDAPRIVGTGTDVGCPHIFGCGDQVLIGVEVNVDGQGAAAASPTVETMYTDCM